MRRSPRLFEPITRRLDRLRRWPQPHGQHRRLKDPERAAIVARLRRLHVPNVILDQSRRGGAKHDDAEPVAEPRLQRQDVLLG